MGINDEAKQLRDFESQREQKTTARDLAAREEWDQEQRRIVAIAQQYAHWAASMGLSKDYRIGLKRGWFILDEDFWSGDSKSASRRILAVTTKNEVIQINVSSYGLARSAVVKKVSKAAPGSWPFD